MEALQGGGSVGPAAPSFLGLISAQSERSPGGGGPTEEWKSYVHELETASPRSMEERLVSLVG